MFGTYRCILALFVVTSHLLAVPIIGSNAVEAFYLLSGFLMTLVMQRTYGYTVGGSLRFLANRGLRLYPMYWAVLLVSVPILIVVGEEASRAYRVFLFVPDSAAQWIQNLTFVYASPFPWDIQPRISPPTWALTVELLYYVCIGIGCSRSRRLTLAWLVISFGLTVALSLRSDGERALEGHLLAGSLPFALGASVFHWRNTLHEMANSMLPRLRLKWFVWGVGAFVASVGLVGLGKLFESFDFLILAGHLVNLGGAAFTVLMLSFLKASKPIEKADRVIGDYTFPLYLLHWQVGLAVSMLCFGRPVRGMHLDGWIVYFLAIVGSVLVAWVLIRYVDEPTQVLRRRFRRKYD